MQHNTADCVLACTEMLLKIPREKIEPVAKDLGYTPNGKGAPVRELLEHFIHPTKKVVATPGIFRFPCIAEVIFLHDLGDNKKNYHAIILDINLQEPDKMIILDPSPLILFTDFDSVCKSLVMTYFVVNKNFKMEYKGKPSEF